MFRRLLCLFAITAVGCSDGGAKGVFAKAAPSVVVVIAQNQGGEPISQGSGVVISETIAVTNCHVIEGAAKVSIRQATDTQVEKSYLMDAEVITRDEVRDLCLLHAPDLAAPPAAKVAKMGSAGELAVGEEVYAIGAPQGLDLSLSRGIVAQLRTGAHGSKAKAPIVQSDAASSPGSSGGGLFNNKGELVGITTFKHSGGENLNFSMPVEDIAELSDAVIEYQQCADKPNYNCLMTLAEKAAEKVKYVYENVIALSAIASEKARAGDLQAAKQLFANAAQSTQSISDIDEYIKILLPVTAAQAKAGYLQGAKTALADAVLIVQQYKFTGFFRNSDRDDVYKSIALAQLEIGDGQGAQQTAQQIGSEDKRLQTVIAIQLKAEDLQGLRESIQTYHERVPTSTDNITFRKVASAHAEAGDIEGAKATASLMANRIYDKTADINESDRERDAKLLASVLSVKAQAGNIASAQKAAEQIDHYYARQQAFSRIAFMQAQVGDIEGAIDTIMQYFKPDYYRESMLYTLLYRQVKAGDIQGAIETARQTAQKELVRKNTQKTYYFDDEYTYNMGLSWIALAQAKTGDMQGAIQTALKINDRNRMAKTLNGIAPDAAQWGIIIKYATRKGRAGDFYEALQTIQSMNNFHKAMILVVLAKEWRASNPNPIKGQGSDS